MEPIYTNLEKKFERILSGVCLTTLREENSRIAQKYDTFDSSKKAQMIEDFGAYLTNYLFFKGYDSVASTGAVLTAKKGDEETEFLVDFDHGPNDGLIKLNVLDKGLKHGISETTAKYVFIISVEKKVICLVGCDNLKSFVKERRNGFGFLTETDALFKSQFVTIDLTECVGKTRVFQLK